MHSSVKCKEEKLEMKFDENEISVCDTTQMNSRMQHSMHSWQDHFHSPLYEIQCLVSNQNTSKLVQTTYFSGVNVKESEEETEE